MSVKVGISTAVVICCAGATYLYLKYKNRERDATKAFNYLTIKIIADLENCDLAVNEIRSKCKSNNAVGFDCEWVTDKGKRQSVALLQLSTLDGYCALFRLNLLKEIPQSLQDLLKDISIYKVGVGPVDDAKYLFQDYSVLLNSTLDLRHLAVICKRQPAGLAGMAKNVLQVILDKSWRVRCSDWEAKELTTRQVNYAAADAHVAILIYDKFTKVIEGRVFKYFAKNGTESFDLCSKYADLNFKANGLQNAEKRKQKNKPEHNGKNRYTTAIRSKPLYDNCILEAPDGEVLSTIDNTKAKWYVSKGLGDEVCSSPLTVRLRFEPAGRSVGTTGRYYQEAKQNRCVVCGSTDSFIRKNVIPREYRKCFPDLLKEHSSHDVVLLCVRCHKRSNMADDGVRRGLATRAGHQLHTRATLEDVDGKKVRSAARALLYQSQKHVLPEERRAELERTVLAHYPQHEALTTTLLEKAANYQVYYENSEYESHGEKVVEYFLQNDGLLRLEEIWREHFLVTMEPKYMPPLWSIKHNEERLRIKFEEGRLSENELKILGLTKWLK